MSARTIALVAALTLAAPLVIGAQQTGAQQAAIQQTATPQAPTPQAPTPQAPTPQERAERMTTAFLAWAEAAGVEGAEIAVARNGDRVLSRAAEGVPGAPRVLGSLGKSVTAQCVAGLVEARRLRWDTTLGQVLGWSGPGAEITVAGLITQSSGLRDDRTQEAMPLWFDGQGNWHAVARWGVVPGEPGFRYNNENYAILGSVIEAVTGQTYAVACDGVLPQARLAPPVEPFAPMGGWQASLGDYAVFQSLLWGNRPPEGPVAELGGDVVYGLGMYGRPRGDAWIWWHLGAICMPGRLEATAYSLVMLDGWTVAVAMDGCPDYDQLSTLDRTLWQAFGNE
ncbi:serine hydrolase domain-containing protein [Pararhodobacter aggregans]|uniref:serine hydrolase domain-containing protein n=1 Tax=Pararhodobacter aggregans TaxID=404875 RepID=UPI003A8ED2CA